MSEALQSFLIVVALILTLAFLVPLIEAIAHLIRRLRGRPASSTAAEKNAQSVFSRDVA